MDALARCFGRVGEMFWTRQRDVLDASARCLDALVKSLDASARSLDALAESLDVSVRSLDVSAGSLDALVRIFGRVDENFLTRQWEVLNASAGSLDVSAVNIF